MKDQIANSIFKILTSTAVVLFFSGIFYRVKFDWIFYTSLFTNKKNNSSSKKSAKKSALFIILGVILLTVSFVFHSIFLKQY